MWHVTVFPLRFLLPFSPLYFVMLDSLRLLLQQYIPLVFIICEECYYFPRDRPRCQCVWHLVHRYRSCDCVLLLKKKKQLLYSRSLSISVFCWSPSVLFSECFTSWKYAKLLRIICIIKKLSTLWWIGFILRVEVTLIIIGASTFTLEWFYSELSIKYYEVDDINNFMGLSIRSIIDPSLPEGSGNWWSVNEFQ